MPNIKDIEYTALFVDNPQDLLSIFKPRHEKVYAHHSTIEYLPENTNTLEIGKKSSIKILGRAYDKKGDALLVENEKSKNKYPHITLSCIKNLDPVYSNELLEKASKDGTLEFFTSPIFVHMTEGYGDFENRIILQ